MSTMYAIVTGGNAGLGFEATKSLCRAGYHVTISARSETKGREAAELVRAEIPAAKIDFIEMELKDLSSVKGFGQEYIRRGHPLHLLVNNAGIMNTPYEMTVDGFESQFQVNHLGHFLLTHYLLPVLKGSGGGRVLSLSSRAHMRWGKPLSMAEVRAETPATYDGWQAYGRSKLCNILFTRYLAKKFPYPSSQVTFNALHPGLVNTKLLNVAEGLRSQAISVEDGARTTLFLCTAAEVEGRSGGYWQDCREVSHDPALTSPYAQSDEESEKLWKASLGFVELTDESYGV